MTGAVAIGATPPPVYVAVQVRDGAVLAVVQVPRKPKLVFAPAASDPLYDILTAVTVVPFCVAVAFHIWLTVCPLANVQVTRQPAMARFPAATCTLAWKPPCH